MAIITTIETDFSGGGGGSRSMYGVSRGQTVKVRPYRYSREGGTRYQSGSLVSGPTVGADVFEHLESMRTGSAHFMGGRTTTEVPENGIAGIPGTENKSPAAEVSRASVLQVQGHKPWYCDVQIAGFLNSVQQFIKERHSYQNVKPGMRKDAPDIFMISFTNTAGTAYSLRFNGNFRESGKAALFREGNVQPAKIDSIDLMQPLREHMRHDGSTYWIQQGLLQSLSHLHTNCGPYQGQQHSSGYNSGGYSGGHAGIHGGGYGGGYHNAAHTRGQAGGSGRGTGWCPRWPR